jgi:predicted nucleic acid-binding protein
LKVFFDTSAFAKRYVAEQGSEKVLVLCEQADNLTVSVICLPELISTLSRLVREKRLAKSDYLRLKHDATSDLADADICQITSDVLTSVVKLLESHPLRAMDAIHIAGALAVNADIFISADHRQLTAARKAGLKVIDVS